MNLKDWIALQHQGQLVKRTSLSYMDHLGFVAGHVSKLTRLGCEIGLCHDLFEETAITANVLHSTLLAFGYTVYDADYIVHQVTELTDVFTKQAYPELRKKERKLKEAKRLATISAGAQTIKYADLIYNISWVMEHETQNKKKKYLIKKIELLTELNKGDQHLRAIALNVANSGLKILDDNNG